MILIFLCVGEGHHTHISPQSFYSPQSISTIISKRSVLYLPKTEMVVAKHISHSLKSERLMLHTQLRIAQSILKHPGWFNAHPILQTTVLLLTYCSSLALQVRGSDERVRNAGGTREEFVWLQYHHHYLQNTP